MSEQKLCRRCKEQPAGSSPDATLCYACWHVKSHIQACAKARGETTRVVHVKDKVPGAVYIGRAMPRQGLKASPLANPYHIGKDGTREEVIAKYRAWLLAQPDLLARLPELRGKALACWCHPERCHGDVLITLLEQLYPEQEGDK